MYAEDGEIGEWEEFFARYDSVFLPAHVPFV